MASASQGVTISSDRLNFEAVPDPKTPKNYIVRHAVATGKVIVDKVVQSSTGKQTTHLEGPKADYAAGATESIVKMSGPMKITSLDEGQHETMVATGSSGLASLEPFTQSSQGNGLRKASLEGPVKMVLTQIDSKTNKPSVVTTTSDHVDLENLGTRRKMTLTGHVHIVGDAVGEFQKYNLMILILDKNGYLQVDGTGGK